jgi:hypothetical protein
VCMAEPASSHILLAALTTLLIEALEAEETRQFGTDRLRNELRDLLARVERELGGAAQPRHLRLADGEASGVSDD